MNNIFNGSTCKAFEALQKNKKVKKINTFFNTISITILLTKIRFHSTIVSNFKPKNKKPNKLRFSYLHGNALKVF